MTETREQYVTETRVTDCGDGTMIHHTVMGYSSMDDQELVDRWAKLRESRDAIQEQMGRMEMEMERRLRERGPLAREIYHPQWIVEMKEPTPDYDQDMLYALKELVAPEQWAKAYTPETTKVVPGRLKMTVAKTWVKLGYPIPEMIEAAKLPARPAKMDIRERK